eukprot:COSAG02_NODE_18_length_54986_cov_345.599322_51_plen_102_part_00
MLLTQEAIGAPIVEVDDEIAEEGENDEEARRQASLKALIDAETVKTQAAVQKAQGGEGATLAAHERDLWVAMERAQIAGRDVIPDKPQNEVPQTSLSTLLF